MDIPDNTEDEKTLAMGFQHILLGTGERCFKKIYNYETFKGLFFAVAVMSEIFANVSGTSLIYLLWETDFLFSHGIYILGCKV